MEETVCHWMEYVKETKTQNRFIRVVIADDHPAVRQALRSMLRSSRDVLVVGEARNGLEAVQMVTEMKPDVLILDMEMPVYNGLQVAEHLQKEEVKTAILVLSGYADRQFIRSMLDYGAKGYLTKDEAPDMIVQAIHGVAQDESGWFSQRVRSALAV